MYLDPAAYLVILGQPVVQHLRDLYEKTCLKIEGSIYYTAVSMRGVNTRLFQEGYRDVELVEVKDVGGVIPGWIVRDATNGSASFMVLASKRQGNVDGSLEGAVNWAWKWVSEDASKRYLWTYKHVLTDLHLEALLAILTRLPRS